MHLWPLRLLHDVAPHCQLWEKETKFLPTYCWILSSPSFSSSLPLLPHSVHPPLSLSSIWLTSDAVVSFFSTSALHHPLPVLTHWGLCWRCVCVCVWKRGGGGMGRWASGVIFLYMTYKSYDFKKAQKQGIRCKITSSNKSFIWCDDTDAF